MIRTDVFLRALLLVLAISFLNAMANAQEDKPIVNTLATSKFGGLPVLPSCATFAVQRGDPTKGASVLLIKTTSGCVIPWHWHTAPEELMFVSGTAKVEMPDSPAHSLTKGDFILLPSKHHHQFTCTASCLFFNSIEGTFDIHYIDKSGNEIPPEQALKKSTPAKKPAQ